MSFCAASAASTMLPMVWPVSADLIRRARRVASLMLIVMGTLAVSGRPRFLGIGFLLQIAPLAGGGFIYGQRRSSTSSSSSGSQSSQTAQTGRTDPASSVVSAPHLVQSNIPFRPSRAGRTAVTKNLLFFSIFHSSKNCPSEEGRG